MTRRQAQKRRRGTTRGTTKRRQPRVGGKLDLYPYDRPGACLVRGWFYWTDANGDSREVELIMPGIELPDGDVVVYAEHAAMVIASKHIVR